MLPAAQVFATHHVLAGTPDQVIAQIRAYSSSGAQEIMVQWLDRDDIVGFHAFATGVFSLV